MNNSEKNNPLHEDSPIVHTVAQLKGRRLRMARALTGFSRQELYDKIGIATSTIDTWESGRVELTEKSAIRVCASLKQVGIYCSGDWLLTGEGNPPRVMDELEKSMLSSDIKNNLTNYNDVQSNAKKIKKIPPFICENVRKELCFFLNLHKKAIYHIVEKDFLNARYKTSDCVAGIEDDLENLIGKIIIASIENEKTVLCKLLSVFENECRVFLSTSKPDEHLKILTAGEILWHRKTKELNQP